ncbi:MAG: VacJ family lipoprotein [Pseudomonadota bacterium]
MKPKLVRGVGVAVLLASGLLQGCATRQNPDPLESYNRKIFAFNETLDDAVLKPTATGYKAVTPQPVRTGISNFVGNLRDVWSAINLFLQGRPGEGATQLMRVSVNTTFGLAGFIDIATPMRLERQNEDFGQTLGTWGVKPGAYIVWPLLGPSTARDSVGLPAEVYYFSASTVMSTTAGANAATVVQLINTRAALLDATNLLDDVALDKYSFVRDGFLQRRQNQVYNGEPPEDDEDEYVPEPEAPPPSDSSPPHSKAPVTGDDWAQITVAELQGLRADNLVR